VISEQEGHELSRTEIAWKYRDLHRDMKSLEDEGRILFFIETKPYCNLYIKRAGKIRNVIEKIKDSLRNKNKAYNVFLKDFRNYHLR
jgi:hypothetical protein